MTALARTDTGNALRATLISPNEADSNGEPANVADGLFAIARSIDHLAAAVTRIAHGGLEEPTGLEALSMTINGGRDGSWPSVTGAILRASRSSPKLSGMHSSEVCPTVRLCTLHMTVITGNRQLAARARALADDAPPGTLARKAAGAACIALATTKSLTAARDVLDGWAGQPTCVLPAWWCSTGSTSWLDQPILIESVDPFGLSGLV
jgi:hypothetical protein